MAAVKAGQVVGNWYASAIQQSYPVTILEIRGKLVPGTSYKDGYAIRSKNFCLTANTNFTPATGLVDADFSNLEASASSDTNGNQPPTGFTTPDGWTKLYDLEGNPYYVPTSAKEDTNGDGIIDEQDLEGDSSKKRSANFLDDPIAWAKANPILAISIVIGLYITYTQLFAKKGKKKKGFLGL
jgi:hypothetical protein